ncbi:Peroxisomal biogenesis factor 6 [Vanrija pseudolonga]|uniref:Peroxisomal ATPase PEX6 n=1 Tax=Vanrija pseudolonga TaxID=143232 RepID=A0AAF0Y6Y8_9TREE|nr:Peroxisomal biogenesis factor 6 [Vanrija pseudolonga]
MPASIGRPFGRPPPIVADVHTLPSASGVAEASSDLWSALLPRSRTSDKPARIAVAVEWQPERRVASVKTKTSRLVTWVVPKAGETSAASPRPRLYVPAQLLPPFMPTPTTVTVYWHDPVTLSLVVVQPTGNDELTAADLAPFYDDATDAENEGKANGSVHFSFDDEPASRAGTIFREGGTVPLTQGSAFRVLMCEPVQQGLISSSTRIIVAERPKGQHADEDTSESIAPTHKSMVDEFDPDTFLASSLAISLAQLADEGDLPPPQEERVDSSSDRGSELTASLTTSGSITPRPGRRTPSPVAAPADVLHPLDSPTDDGGMKFIAVRSTGRGVPVEGSNDDDVCYAGVWALGCAGVFEGDWVTIKASSEGGPSRTRLARVVAWERLDQEDSELPPNTILIPPSLFRALFPVQSTSTEVTVQPTSFGARRPTLPVAQKISIARVATAEGVDKRYERSWLKGLRNHFTTKDVDGERVQRLVRRGDIIAVPVWQDKPLAEGEELEAEEDGDDSDNEDGVVARKPTHPKPTALAYFVVTSLTFEPLVPLEDDFSSSSASKARAGELGCWVDADVGGDTSMVLGGLERERVCHRGGDLLWNGLAAPPAPYSTAAVSTMRDLVRSAFSNNALARLFPLSVLVKGARGSGKRSFVRAVADELGLSVIDVPCFDIVGDTPQATEGTLRARLDKARSCAPAVLLLSQLEAFAPPSSGGSAPPTRPPPIVKVIEDILAECRKSAVETGQPVVLVGTTSNSEGVPRDMLACFKHEIALPAPSAPEREVILGTTLGSTPLAPDVVVSHVAAQAAALNAGDLVSLIDRARDTALARACSSAPSASDALLAGVSLTAADLTAALGDARASYADSIGAPRIPNVSWDDVGGLAAVKNDILDTVQLPLDHPELFADGMKKRSGILLYGPPGTGKTLLAKAVATSCAANFLSVKGPELLNMYIGESEANVRRVFEKARDASPCVIFMDELDSVAPKRGNQGDSGGVMDRIVSQLLAELDGMASGRGQVVVMAATNRPDLLDPALLRPGRFDRMLYLSVPETHAAQRDVLAALTRKFTLDPALSLDAVAERLPFTYTGADLYALCADAMLSSMTRVAGAIDKRVEELDAAPAPRNYPTPLTVQYYLASMATKEETDVIVKEDDFVHALERLLPSVSADEMAHYRRVQEEFKGFSIGADKQ